MSNPVDPFALPPRRVKAEPVVYGQAAPYLTSADAQTGLVRGRAQAGISVSVLADSAVAGTVMTGSDGVFEMTISAPIAPGTRLYPFCPQVGAGLVVR